MSDVGLGELFPELGGILAAMDQQAPAADPLATDPEHGGITDDQIALFFQNNPAIRTLNPLISNQQTTTAPFQSGTTGPAPQGGVEDANGHVIGAPPAQPYLPPAPPPTGPAPIQAPGQPAQPVAPAQPAPLDAVTLKQLQDLQAEIVRDPSLRAKIVDHYVGRATPPASQPPTGVPAPPFPQQFVPPAPIGTPPVAPVTQPRAEPILPAVPQFTSAPPANLDLDDPSIAALWQQTQQLQAVIGQQQAQLQATQQTVQQSAQQQNLQTQQQMDSYYASARAGFKTKYGLEDADLDKLDGVATRLGVLPQLMSGVDPMTGLPVRPDVMSAIDRAFEIAYFVDPTYRQREWARQATLRKDDAQHKQRLAAVAGSSGSIPRTTPAPTTDQGRHQAMLSEVGEMLNGNWSEPVAN